MNLPVGTLIKEGMQTKKVDFHKLFSTLKAHNLNGYLMLDIMTNNGIEGGSLLFKDGEIIAADYRYLAKDKTLHGEEALKLFMNACIGDGNFDIYDLGDKIVDVRESNREDVLKYKPSMEEVAGMIPDTFTELSPEEEAKKVKVEAIKSMGGVSKDEVMRKYGIVHPDDRMVDKIIKGVIDGSA
jgi:hypothetical protein